MKSTSNRFLIAAALLVLASSAAGATETHASDKRVALEPTPNPWYDVLVKGETSSPNSFMFRDIFVMGGEDLNKWPYIEHSDAASSGYVQGINLVIPDKSKWGWRFITRVSEIPYNAKIRATIDADGNGIFTGDATAHNVNAKAAVTASRVKIDGVAITAGTGAPAGNCSAGDLYLRKGGGGAPIFTCAQDNTWVALSTASGARSTASAPAGNPVVARSSFDERSLEAAPDPTNLATVHATLGASSGETKRWYVCALVEANTLQTAHQLQGSMLDVGIATANAGSGTPFRMYSRPDNDTNKSTLGKGIVSDWLAAPTGTATGRYCNSYSSGEDVAFTAYALSPAKTGAIYTSGQIEIQALPQ